MPASKEQARKGTTDKKRKNIQDSEFAAEIADPSMLGEKREDYAGDGDTGASNQSLGLVALAMSIASLFVLPQWFGLAGIVLGGAAWLMGFRGLGLWSIIIGSISLIAYIVLVPYYS
jgi:hypothetical protein